MATSAIGPGFLTQTAVFTGALRADFAFAILASIVVDVAAQVNVWRVLGVARRRGQELASELVPGLGPAVALLVAFGGLVFNVGNIAGCGLGLAILGVPAALGATASAAAAVVLLSLPRAARVRRGTSPGPPIPASSRRCTPEKVMYPPTVPPTSVTSGSSSTLPGATAPRRAAP